jgi:RimK family alpha-L-glutamate ligase
MQQIAQMQAVQISTDHPVIIPGSSPASGKPEYHVGVRILILSARPDTPSNRRLVEAADKAEIAIDLVDATDLTATTTGQVCGRRDTWVAEPPDVVLARVGNWRPDSLLALLETLTAQGAATPNPAAAMRIGRDHWQTMHTLSKSGIPVPLTLAGADPEALAAAANDRLEFPVVVKQRRSRMGVGVIRCRTLDHLEAVLDSLWRLGDEVIVQQYHETGGRSLRLLVVGSRVVASARFEAAGKEWRSNAARGGVVTPIVPDEHAVALAVAATRSAGLGICGVDLLPAKDGLLVGEVNPTPGFVGLERATGVDVAGAIVAHLSGLAG